MTSYDLLTDKELTDLLLIGDDKAFSQIFKRYNGLLFIHAFKKLGNEEEAKDVVQDVFAILWFKRADIIFKSNLIGYLYTAVRNKIFDFIARQEVASKYVSSLGTFINDGNNITDHLIREKQVAQLIESEINLLPPRMKATFILSRTQHKSYKEIASDLSISEETVKDQIKKALKILKSKLRVVGVLILLNFLF